jgi:hypothetical protein
VIFYIRDADGNPTYLDIPADMSVEVASQVITLAVEVETLRGGGTADINAVLARIGRARIAVAQLEEIDVQW